MSRIQSGHQVTVAAPRTVLGGDGVLIGAALFGIAAFGAASGASLEIEMDGVHDLAKDASTFTDGAFVYWDDVAHKATSVATGREIGAAELLNPDGTSALGGVTGDATVRVRLNGFAGRPNALRAAHYKYDFAVDGGASCTPANSDTIPANAVLLGGAANSTTALTAAGSATFAVGTTAGSSASSILTATAKASLSANAVVPNTCAATPIKMTAAGQIAVTVATGPLTAGVVEGWVLYTVAGA